LLNEPVNRTPKECRFWFPPLPLRRRLLSVEAEEKPPIPGFKPYNYDQVTMVVINYRNRLQPGNLEYAVHYLIEHKLDLSVF
jgi:hypothetical protein